MLTRVPHARDLDTDLELSQHLLGHLMRLELHHIFPKAKLYKHDYNRPEVNALGNFMFLTQETNLRISDSDPVEYLTRYRERNPGVLESQWIPTDAHLWRYENYRDFLAARRSLLADAANAVLDSLNAGKVPETLQRTDSVAGLPVSTIAADPTDEEAVLLACNEWVVGHGLPEGEFYFELLGEDAAQPVAQIDLAWPDWLQPGFSQPVALLLDEETDVVTAVNRAGYLFFKSLDAFRRYVERDILSVQPAAD